MLYAIFSKKHNTYLTLGSYPVDSDSYEELTVSVLSVHCYNVYVRTDKDELLRLIEERAPDDLNGEPAGSVLNPYVPNPELLEDCEIHELGVK